MISEVQYLLCLTVYACMAAAAAIGAGSNLVKQNQIFPPPPSGSDDPEKKGRGMTFRE